ncbi:MAG: hypothetical protein WD872_06750 [Pirellulaceae bacterium]
MSLSRRNFVQLASASAGLAAARLAGANLLAQEPAALAAAAKHHKDLTIKEVRVTPIALPDPPILAASGCHGPYFFASN